ncbi:MAG: hypothetical protein HND57_12320 [Planctomycetes bacterium]|nr:hypothetical protein [Planctomycetota bacterium]
MTTQSGTEQTGSTEQAIRFSAKPIIVASHPRSGTHLTIDGLRHFFCETYQKQRFNQPVHDLYINLDRLEPDHQFYIPPERMTQLFERCRKRVIVKTHGSVQADRVGPDNRAFAQGILAASDIVYVVRDVRPVLVSYMALRPMKYPDSPTEISTFLKTDLDGYGPPAAAWAAHVNGWLDRPEVVEVVKFEDMRSNYEKTIADLGAALGMTRNARPIRVYPKPRSIVENKLRRLLGRQLSSSIDNLRMKMTTPKWKDVMSEGDLALIREQAGDTMARLGYAWS